MNPERPNLDWPQPLPREEVEQRAAEGVQTAASEVGMLLSGISSTTRAAFTDLTASVWEESPSALHSLRHVASLLSRLDDAGRYSFAALALRERKRYRELFRVLGTSHLLALWLIEGEWRAVLTPSIAAERVLTTSLERFWQAYPNGRDLDEAGQAAALRLWHRRETLFVAWSDLIDRKPVDALTREISALADASIEIALELVLARLARKNGASGEIPDAARLCVLSMGKLGGQELNYRSDIDLIFLYDDESKGLGRLDAPLWHARVVEALMKTLAQVTELGFLYRVDARLRPDGARGALVRNYAATLAYYRQRGTTWERQAMLKVRASAGNLALGEKLIEALQPWIFRRFLGVRAVKEIKGLKRQIEARAHAKDETYRDVKTGFGGIRDIEFVVQFLQLLHGGRILEIRGANTLKALAALETHGLLREPEAEHFMKAYAFLRRVEHLLQLEQGTQTHRLPEKGRDFELLARRLGYRSQKHQSASEALRTDIALTTQRTRHFLMLLFNELFSGTDGREAEIEILLDEDAAHEDVARVLGAYGFADCDEAWRAILAMSREQPAFKRFEPRVRAYLASALPHLLDFVKQTPDPDITLANFERVTSGLGAKGIFYELVARRAEMLRVFGALCAYSTSLIEIIQRRAGLLDEFLEVIREERAHDLESLRAEVEARSLAAMSFAEGARWTHDLEILRIGLFDVSGRSSTHETMRDLAVLAHAIVGHGTKHALSATLERFPEFAERKAALFDQFVIVAVGKFGAGGMNYESDLDLIFVHGGVAKETAFYDSAAKLLRKELSAIYEVDLRLRPMGSSGTLVSTLVGIADYFQNSARFWERLALTRARVVVNAEFEIGQHVADLIEHFVYETPLPEDAAQEVERMRREMVVKAGVNDLKRGIGGLLDFEMTVEYLQLLHGGANRKLRLRDTVAAADALILAGHDRDRLLTDAKDAYLTLRRIVKRIQLSKLSLAALDEDELHALRLARMLGFDSPRETRDAIEASRRKLRAGYAALVLGDLPESQAI